VRDALAIACFVLTGAAGLIYQVCWIRRASLVFGSTVFALGTVLAVFFLGLALGSYLFGEVSRRSRHPLRIYAALEIGVAVLGAATLPAFDFAEELYGVVYRATQGAPGLHALLRFGLVALVILAPTVLMGGTLPLFCRHYVRRRSRIARSAGMLYALNTLGAAAGCAATGFYLLPVWGLQASVHLAVVLNLAAGGVVGALQWSRRVELATADGQGTRPAIRPALLAVVFLAGLVGLGYEVVWTRYLTLLVRNTVHTYTLTLTVFLVGIVLGGAAASALFDRRLPRGAVFATLHLLLGLGVLALLRLPPAFWAQLQAGPGVYVALLLPPAVLAGASFPMAVRLAVDDPAAAGSGVGRIAAVNTAGGIAGSLATALVALPRLGLEATTLVLTGLNVAAGLLALWTLQAGLRRTRAVLAAAGVLAWLLVPQVSGTRIPQDFLARDGELVDFREGLESNLAVVRRDRTRVLEIDGWWQGQDRTTHQIMAAHLPMLLHPEARRVLIVGVGAGQTAARFLLHPITRLDCVDIEPAVFELIRPHFQGGWMDDPRVALLPEDGRGYLMHTAARYDVIALEVGQIFRPGAASFYTIDFYRRARERLEPGGMLWQFVPLPFFSVETFRSTVRTFVEVFPASLLWYNTSELLLAGVNADRLALDASRLETALADPRIRDDLSFSHWGGPRYRLHRPEVLLGGLLAGARGLAGLGAGAPILTDDRPVLEYATTGASALDANELPLLEILRRHLEPPERLLDSPPGPERLAEIHRVRARNLDDLAASALARRAETLRATLPGAELAAILERAAARNPENRRIRRLLADALVQAGRLDEARASYERALALDPGDALAHRGLGVVHQVQGRLEEAAGRYRAALEIDPEDPEAHNNLGAALGGLGDYPGALHHFERALALRPAYADARRNLARLRAHLGGGPRR
jgi:spermidine synthase